MKETEHQNRKVINLDSNASRDEIRTKLERATGHRPFEFQVGAIFSSMQVAKTFQSVANSAGVRMIRAMQAQNFSIGAAVANAVGPAMAIHKTFLGIRPSFGPFHGLAQAIRGIGTGLGIGKSFVEAVYGQKRAFAAMIQAVAGWPHKLLYDFKLRMARTLAWVTKPLQEFLELIRCGYHPVRWAASGKKYWLQYLAVRWRGPRRLYAQLRRFEGHGFSHTEFKEDIRIMCWRVAESDEYPNLPKNKFARTAHELFRQYLLDEIRQFAQSNYGIGTVTLEGDNQPYIFTGDAARIAGMSPSTIRRRLESGDLPGKRARYDFTSKGAWNDRTWFIPWSEETRRQLEALNPDTGHDPDLLLTPKEVATRLGTSPRNLRRLDGSLSQPPVYEKGRKRYTSSHVEEFDCLLAQRAERRLANLRPA